MTFIADLHIHSKYSRATAKNLDFEHLYAAAQIKGITVVGTGDFTFPAWQEEIETKLEETLPGLFSLKPEYAEKMDSTIPESCRGPVYFILQTEISNIYKKKGRVRKNHNLIFFPDLESVAQFNATLDGIGNIKSDGRPILGLDARNLLEIMLEINDRGFFVPAHIWTPWFSLFGSRSGFDSMAECFEDLSSHIFAVETGLSSDPPMNWRVSDLDHVRLISNSDAHSPGYLGRNASVFNTGLNFEAIRSALAADYSDTYQGTLDMYPHQGKYHYDGHRKCGICLNPSETINKGGICPVCGKPLTLGVLHRVQELADRSEGFDPQNRHGYQRIIPLTDILSEIFGVGPKTKKVSGFYNKAVAALGPELSILTDRSIQEIRTAGVPLLAEAIEKMRTGEIHIDPGFDGEFGKVKLFTAEEKERLSGDKHLFKSPVKRQLHLKPAPVPAPPRQKKRPAPEQTRSHEKHIPLLAGLNPEQKKAVESPSKAMVIQAGPGTGKTRTLTARIAYLISDRDVRPGSILALTFTNKAARELNDRISAYLPDARETVPAATFHSFSMMLLKEYEGFNGTILDEEGCADLISRAMGPAAKKREHRRALETIASCKQQLLGGDDDLSGLVPADRISEFQKVYQAYEAMCAGQNAVDFEGLIHRAVQLLSDETIAAKVHQTYTHIFIDEYQDLNYGQYMLARLLAKENAIFAIGDPDQSIYGFRGSDNRFFRQFEMDFNGCETIFLKKNYRSTQTILDASYQMISKPGADHGAVKIVSQKKGKRKIYIKETASEKAEAVAIGKMIEEWVGGTSFLSVDAGKAGDGQDTEYSFADFAVLYRTGRQCRVIIEVFEKAGIPFQTVDRADFLDREGIRQLVSICRVIIGSDTWPDMERTLTHYHAGLGIKARDKLRSGYADARPRGRTGLEILAAPGTLDGLKKAADHLSRIREALYLMKEATAQMDARTSLAHISQEAGLDGIFEKTPEAKDGVDRLIALAGRHPRLNDFINSLSLGHDTDTVRFDTEKVSLMTIHAAKGLEFPVVFVAGCEQGLLPFSKGGTGIEDLDEERRIFYVAMTRAMDILCLTYAKKRRIYGRDKKQQRSIFIADIEKQLMQVDKKRPVKPKRVKEEQLELF